MLFRSSPGTTILSQLSGTTGGVGTYTINNSTTAPSGAISVFHLSTDVNKAPRINYGNVIFESTLNRNDYVYGSNVFQNFTDKYQSAGAHTLFFETGKTNVFLASDNGIGFDVNGFSIGSSLYRTIINTCTTGGDASTNYHYLYLDVNRKSTRLNSSHVSESRMPSSA